MTVPKFPGIKEKKVFLQDIPNKAVKKLESGITECWIDEANNIVSQNKSISLEGKIGGRVSRKDYDELPNGHWHFEEDMRSKPKAVGFIYIIKDIAERRLYLGKKSYVGAGKKNKGVESNWKWYISSSKLLSASIKENGKDNFEFYCVEEYCTKGGLSFAETWSLCSVEALNEGSIWYNGLIGKVSWKVKEAVTERHKKRLTQIIHGEI